MDANERAYYVFGQRDDTNAVALIPEADDVQFWNSICHDCKGMAAFGENGKILCRPCRQSRREITMAPRKSKNAKKKRMRENDSNESVSVKRMSENYHNLSLEDNEETNDRKEALETTATKDDAKASL